VFIPEYGSGYRRKNPRVVEIRPLGCRESAGSNLARSDEPLCGLPTVAGGAKWRIDHFHLGQFTAPCLPVQCLKLAIDISIYRCVSNDYGYFKNCYIGAGKAL
jgi:hypothetical protein